MVESIVIITDAWHPQVNGVVTTYSNLMEYIKDRIVTVISPNLFKTIPNLFYKEIPISICSKRKMRKLLTNIIKQGRITHFHIATEGPLGIQARRVLRDLKINYSTAYHTKFPEFIKKLYGIPMWTNSWYFNWFHKNSKFVLMSSNSVAKHFPKWNCRIMGKGFDKYFKFNQPYNINPILVCVSRVSKEKNIEDFCRIKCNVKIVKIVVGDGPHRKELQEKYPDVEFVGYKFGKELAEYYRKANVMVFPSRTDTFGIVVLESMACGTPVAAYPVDGAKDQIVNGLNGFMGENLTEAALKCLSLNRMEVASSVQMSTWENAAKDFIKYIEE